MLLGAIIGAWLRLAGPVPCASVAMARDAARPASSTRGAPPPAVFIPLAGDCGLIARLGETAVREVAGQIARWRAQGLPLLPVAIDLSMDQVQGMRGAIRAGAAAHAGRAERAQRPMPSRLCSIRRRNSCITRRYRSSPR